MDFLQNLDPSKVILVQTVLCLLIAPAVTPTYNLPIFLFGIYVSENTDHVLPTQAFTSAVGLSFFSDVIWLSVNRSKQGTIVQLITIIIMLLKLPLFLVFVNISRSHGGGLHDYNFRGGNLPGSTVWSIPGGFTSGGREGYQNIDEEGGVRIPAQAPSQAPKPQPIHTHPPAPPVPGSYQGA